MPLICTIGEALYGPHWVRPLAEHLQVSERTMRYWQAGERDPPAGVWVDLAKACRERVAILEAMAGKLEDGQ